MPRKKYAHENRQLSKSISYEVTYAGFEWSYFSSLLIYLVITGYFIVFPVTENFVRDSTLLFSGYTALTIGCLLFVSGKAKPWEGLFRMLGCVWISISYVIAAISVAIIWEDVNSAEKILVIGFLVMMVGWHTTLALVLCALIPIFIAYLFISTIGPKQDILIHILTIAKFPLLLFVLRGTVRKFFITAESRFAEKIMLIEKLQKRTNIDELTNIANRRGFNESLSAAVENSRRFNIPTCLVVMDIDFFKQYNDSLGHPAGDWCLSKVASILKEECKRSTDVVARIGGEEFALILPNSNTSQTVALIKQIQNKIRKAKIEHPDSSISPLLTISIGIAEWNEEDCESLYKRADKAMYRSKVEGRNRYTTT